MRMYFFSTSIPMGMPGTQSLPELKLYAFTNERYTEASTTTPHQVRQIIQQRRVKSSNAHSVKSLKKAWFHSSASRSRPGSIFSKCGSKTQTPGYTLLRTTSSVEMRINVVTFFNQDQTDKKQTAKDLMLNSRYQYSGNQSTTIAKLTQESLEREECLQREIVDLTIQLDDVKRKRENEAQQQSAQLEFLKKRLEKGFESDRKKQEATFEEQLKRIHERHLKEMESLKTRLMMEKAQLEEEIQQYQDLMEKTKDEMRLETEERLKALERAMREQSEEEIKKAVENLKQDERQIIAKTKKEVTNTYKGKMEAMENKYTAVIEKLEGECLGVSKLLDSLNDANRKIEAEKMENKYLHEQLQQKMKEAIELESKLLNTETKLTDLQENYHSKIKSFEECHFKKFDDLRLENSNLRSRLMEKVTLITNQNVQLHRLQSKAKADLKFKLKSVIQARANAQLVMIPESALITQPLWQDTATSRPLSAPGTSRERHQLCTSAIQRKKKELSQQ